MVKNEWVSVSLPFSLIEKIDIFLKSKKAQEYGVTSRSQIISLLMRDFVNNNYHLSYDSNPSNLSEVDDSVVSEDEVSSYVSRFFGSSPENIEEDLSFMEKTGKTTPWKIVSKNCMVIKDKTLSEIVYVKMKNKKITCSFHKTAKSCNHILFALKEPSFIY